MVLAIFDEWEWKVERGDGNGVAAGLAPTGPSEPPDR